MEVNVLGVCEKGGGGMGLEFKPYFAWEDEERGCQVGKCGEEKQQATSAMVESAETEDSGSDSGSGAGASDGDVDADDGAVAMAAPSVAVPGVGLVFVHADGTPAVPGAPVVTGSRELAPSLAAVNHDGREYAVLVASEEDNVNEYKSFFSIVLDYPQFLGQGETKDSALRQASRLLHYALGSMVLKNETIPAPSAGAELEVRG